MATKGHERHERSKEALLYSIGCFSCPFVAIFLLLSLDTEPARTRMRAPMKPQRHSFGLSIAQFLRIDATPRFEARRNEPARARNGALVLMV